MFGKNLGSLTRQFVLAAGVIDEEGKIFEATFVAVIMVETTVFLQFNGLI